MPLSATIHLEATADAVLDQFTGRGVHGFWFNRWREVDEKLGDELHASSEIQPFTLSPLMGLARPSPRGRGVGVRAGSTAWFRVTALTDALTEAVKSKWLEGLTEEGRVLFIPQPKEEEAGAAWKATRIVVEADESYEAMSKRHLMNSAPPRAWTMEFTSPTTFHGAGGHLPFPLPDSLIGSWLRRWNAFAPIALPKEELLEWARAKLVVSSFTLRTAPAREGERLRVGCVGRLGLRALEMPPYLRAAIDLLTRYARFCGSGSHTAQGLGQTKFVAGR
jgi:CRISPR-associated endoribonuclease Cas6